MICTCARGVGLQVEILLSYVCPRLLAHCTLMVYDLWDFYAFPRDNLWDKHNRCIRVILLM